MNRYRYSLFYKDLDYPINPEIFNNQNINKIITIPYLETLPIVSYYLDIYLYSMIIFSNHYSP